MLGLVLSLAMAAQAGIPPIDAATTPTKPLSAPRAAAPSEDTCDEPVLLVVSGPVRDAARMEAYARAVASSGLYQQLGGYDLTAPRAIDQLEGAPGGAQFASVTRFPCRANALAFWNSTTYQTQLKGLRSGPAAADLFVAIYPELALRSDLTGKVGEAEYSGSFDPSAVPQVARP